MKKVASEPGHQWVQSGSLLGEELLLPLLANGLARWRSERLASAVASGTIGIEAPSMIGVAISFLRSLCWHSVGGRWPQIAVWLRAPRNVSSEGQ